MAVENTNYEKILKQRWGYDSFRPLQKEIIESVCSGTDTLAILPTGGGKSLTYQVPAMVLDGVVIVVSPLIALMTDQVESLKKRGISYEIKKNFSVKRYVCDCCCSCNHNFK